MISSYSLARLQLSVSSLSGLICWLAGYRADRFLQCSVEMRPYVSAALLLLLLALAKMEEHGGRDNDMFLLQDGQYVKSLLEEELTRESYEVSKLERKGEEEENQKTVLQHEEGEEERGKVRLVKNVNHQVILLEVREEGDYYPSANYTADEEEDREGGGVHDEDGDDEEEGKIQDNCTHPRQPFPWYNDSCDFVHAECGGKSELIDYLAFVLCDLPKAQVGAMLIFFSLELLLYCIVDVRVSIADKSSINWSELFDHTIVLFCNL